MASVPGQRLLLRLFAGWTAFCFCGFSSFFAGIAESSFVVRRRHVFMTILNHLAYGRSSGYIFVDVLRAIKPLDTVDTRRQVTCHRWQARSQQVTSAFQCLSVPRANKPPLHFMQVFGRIDEDQGGLYFPMILCSAFFLKFATIHYAFSAYQIHDLTCHMNPLGLPAAGWNVRFTKWTSI